MAAAARGTVRAAVRKCKWRHARQWRPSRQKRTDLAISAYPPASPASFAARSSLLCAPEPRASLEIFPIFYRLSVSVSLSCACPLLGFSRHSSTGILPPWQPARPSPGPPSTPSSPFTCAARPFSADVLRGETAVEPRRAAAAVHIITAVAETIACQRTRAGLAEVEFGTTSWDRPGPAWCREVGIGLRLCRLCRMGGACSQTITTVELRLHLWCRDDHHGHNRRRHQKRTC